MLRLDLRRVCDSLCQSLLVYSRSRGTGSPEAAQCWVDIGAALRRLARCDDAARAYEQAHAIYARLPGAQRQCGASLCDAAALRRAQRQWTAADETYERALATLVACGPESADDAARCASDCARLLVDTAQYERAATMFEVLHLAPVFISRLCARAGAPPLSFAAQRAVELYKLSPQSDDEAIANAITLRGIVYVRAALFFAC